MLEFIGAGARFRRTMIFFRIGFGAVDLWHLRRDRSPGSRRSDRAPLVRPRGKWFKQLSLAARPRPLLLLLFLPLEAYATDLHDALVPRSFEEAPLSRPLRFFVNLLRWKDARREFFAPKLQYFLSFKYIPKYKYININILNIKAEQVINLLLRNNFYLAISCRRVEEESDELLYTVWSLVMVREPIASANNLVAARITLFLAFFLFLSSSFFSRKKRNNYSGMFTIIVPFINC